jgi:hypothetical protein
MPADEAVRDGLKCLATDVRGPPRKSCRGSASTSGASSVLARLRWPFFNSVRTSPFFFCESPAHARTHCQVVEPSRGLTSPALHLSPTPTPTSSPKSGVSCLNRMASYLLATSAYTVWGLWCITQARDSRLFFFIS